MYKFNAIYLSLMYRMKGILIYCFFLLHPLFSDAQVKEYTVLFEYNKYQIPDTAMLYLVKYINNHPIEKVVLEGHCDSVGSHEYNYTLSDNRANEVKKLLVQNGLSASMISKCIGYGKEKPLVENDTEKDRQLNRRVHISFFLKEQKEEKLEQKKSTKPISKNESIQKIVDAKEGENIILENLLFQPGRHYLQYESMYVLDDLVKAMQQNPTLKIEIQGHVCCTTTEPDGFDIDERTENLSFTRAKEIYNYLLEAHISGTRMKYAGYAGTRKINQDESTEELRRVNRRVEIKILKK